VHGSKSDSGSSRNWSSGVCDGVILLHIFSKIAKSWLNIEPCTSVLWLFLGPCYRGVRVFPKVGNESLEGEWAETFDSDEGYVILSLFLSGFVEVIVDLA